MSTNDGVTLLLGTTKGAFLLVSDPARQDWSIKGPFCDLWPINHVIGDPGSDRLWAAGGSAWHGAGVWRSDDGGDTWSLAKFADGQIDEFRKANPELAATFGMADSPPGPYSGEIDSIWSLCLSHGTLYAGSRPAILFQSLDSGASWQKVGGLTEDPSAEGWNPGAAGLTLHTIVPHPDTGQKLWVGISAAGVFATEDGGASWDRRNRRDNAPGYTPSDHPASGSDTEIGHCVHNIVRAGGDGDLLYQQNHHGVFRSNDGARTWQNVTDGLPSTFGFPIAVHPHDPRTVWTLPLNGDSSGRFPPDASAAVWRSRDGGGTWTAMRTGLPQKTCFFTVLRQAMATDGCTRPGVYFGTNSGTVFASIDEGATWSDIARHLPTVLSVETVNRAL